MEKLPVQHRLNHFRSSNPSSRIDIAFWCWAGLEHAIDSAVLDPKISDPAEALRQAEDLRELVLRELVLRYLAEHPDAMDTLDGIAEWWVTREQLRVDMQRLTKVLGELTRSGILEETGSGNGRIYHLATRPDSTLSNGGRSR